MRPEHVLPLPGLAEYKVKLEAKAATRAPIVKAEDIPKIFANVDAILQVRHCAGVRRRGWHAARMHPSLARAPRSTPRC